VLAGQDRLPPDAEGAGWIRVAVCLLCAGALRRGERVGAVRRDGLVLLSAPAWRLFACAAGASRSPAAPVRLLRFSLVEAQQPSAYGEVIGSRPGLRLQVL